MSIKTIDLAEFERDVRGILSECADSHHDLMVELPDHRLLTIRPVEDEEDDSLTDKLLASNQEFRELAAESAASPRLPFL